MSVRPSIRTSGCPRAFELLTTLRGTFPNKYFSFGRKKPFSNIKKTFLVIKPCSTVTAEKKKLRAFGPQFFFLAKFWGLNLCRRVLAEILRRRVMAEILAEICAAVCWPKSAPPCDGRNLREIFFETGLTKKYS